MYRLSSCGFSHDMASRDSHMTSKVHPIPLSIQGQFDVAFIIERAKHQHAFEHFTETKLSTLQLDGTLQPMYRLYHADHLSAITS